MTIKRTLTRCEVITVTYKVRENDTDPLEVDTVKNDKGQFIRKVNGEARLVRVFDLDGVKDTTVWPSQQEVSALAQPELDFKVTASHEVEYVDGPLLSIDPDEMASAFKTSSLSVSYHENTLQLNTINATIEGMEAEAASAGIKLATSVAALALGLPPVGLVAGSASSEREGGPQTWSTSACSEKALADTKAYRTTDANLRTYATRSTNVAATIEALNKKKEAGTASADDLESLGKLTAEAKQLEAKIKDATALKTELDKDLSRSVSRNFFDADTAHDAAGPEKDTLTDAQLSEWLGDLIPKLGDLNSSQMDSIRDKVTVFASLTPLDTTYSCSTNCGFTVPDSEPAADAPTPDPKAGVLYRIPVSSLLLVTTKDSADRISDVRGARKQSHDLVFEMVRVPQFGPIRSLPLESDWGEKNNLTATFAKSGLPTAIAYIREKAPGVAALSTANEAVQAMLSIREQIEAEEAADLAASVAEEQAEIDSVTRQVELLTKQKELEALLAVPNPELVDLQAVLARLQLLAAIKGQEDLLAGVAEGEGGEE